MENRRLHIISLAILFTIWLLYMVYETRCTYKKTKAARLASEAERDFWRSCEAEEKKRTEHIKQSVDMMIIKPVPRMQFRWPWEKLKL